MTVVRIDRQEMRLNLSKLGLNQHRYSMYRIR